MIFPGRRWGGPGPDFVGALLVSAAGDLVRGDVEVHTRASDWRAHGHARDPNYAAVVLHVVGRLDVRVPHGEHQHVPTVELEPLAHAPPLVLPGPPCLRTPPHVLDVVAEAGRARFESRVARYEADLSVAEPDQVVWRGLAEGLGFQRNTRAFGELAQAVEWAEAARAARERGPVGVAGLLLGAAGLVAEASLAEAHAWRGLQRRYGLRAALSRASWDRRQQRFANAPASRCRGLAELAARWSEPHHDQPGLAAPLLEAVRQAAARRPPRPLWRLVHAPPWIGRGRAQVLVNNVIVPFAAAAGLAEARPLFERLPGEPPNRVLRYMAGQLGAPAVTFRGACLQQGLLQLFGASCARRLCEHCPASTLASAPDAELPF